MTGQPLSGDAVYGPVCACGKQKRPYSRVCASCRGWQSYRPVGESVHQVGRAESIITFRHLETGRLETRYAYGKGVLAQLDNGLAHLPGDPSEWEVASRSTPSSILTDLQKTSAL